MPDTAVTRALDTLDAEIRAARAYAKDFRRPGETDILPGAVEIKLEMISGHATKIRVAVCEALGAPKSAPIVTAAIVEAALIAFADAPDRSGPSTFLDLVKDDMRAALTAALAVRDGDGWQPINSAKKDGTTIWAILCVPGDRLLADSDLDRWDGVQIPLRHPGLADDGFDIGWNVSAPVGHGGFPDSWIAGWRPLPEHPCAAPPKPAPCALPICDDAGGGP